MHDIYHNFYTVTTRSQKAKTYSPTFGHQVYSLKKGNSEPKWGELNQVNPVS